MSGGERRVKITLINKNGLHARPAHLFVQTANQFRSELLVAREGVDPVNGKSIMGIMMLAAESGTTLELVADGPDADDQLVALQSLVESRFGEE